MEGERGTVLAAGEGRRIVGGPLDVTVKMTLDHPALTSTFEVMIGPGFDVGAHVHDLGEEVFYIVDGELDLFAFEPIDRTVADWHEWESPSGERPRRAGPGAFMFVPQGTPHAFSNPTDLPTKVLFQSSVPGGHENYFDELVAILEAGRGTPDPERLAELRTRYHIEELTSLR
ncbi:MAG: cupin domain-containing protein [Actinobacteria bacterium]|nr:cupin domain-containing protein [Actinomycetota bacterium]